MAILDASDDPKPSNEERLRAAVSAVTAGFVDLLSVLAQRGVIDKGDAAGTFDLMRHALRHPGSEQALAQIQTWAARIVPHAPDSLPLPPEAPSDG